MTTDPELTRVLHAFLEDGADRMPERVFRGAMDAVPGTRQRGRSWLPLRLDPMMPLVRAGAIAAVLVVVALGGMSFLSDRAGVGTVTPTPTATPNPTPTPTWAPTPTPLPSGGPLESLAADTMLGAGTYDVGAPFAKPFSVTLPAESRFGGVESGAATFAMQDGGSVEIFLPEAVFPDPCHITGDPVPVSSADELVAALSTMRGFSASTPTATTVARNPAKTFVITNTIDTATAGCTRSLMLPMFTQLGNSEGAATNGGARQVVWVVDVGGQPLLVIGDGWQDADRSTLESVVETIALR
jgi:hypothetical protein